MPLSAGDKLGPYEILSPIGKGGMGEVWRARDPRLNRDVAIKTSAEHFSDRFEREAHAIAALNHSNICQIYDVGPNYLVMEYIDGTPLKGPLPVDQALKYAAQICDALDAAHKKGITHRDLKPANILVAKSGIKLLDFGLAKFGSAGSAPVPAEVTMTMALTGKNQIVGTLYYMSPEQLQSDATGQEIDCRSDIFSFGVVLYELLTGRRAFEGTSPASVIAAIMERPAPSIADIAPPALDRVLRKCLAKDPHKRWQSARDLKDELEWIAAAPEPGGAAPVAPAFGDRWWLPWSIAAFLLLALVPANITHLRETPPERQHIRFQIAPPGVLRDFKLSPDGRFLAFAGYDEGALKLWIRALDSLETRLLTPMPALSDLLLFWSTDGEYIGFATAGKMYKIARTGGSPVTICDFQGAFRGAAWRSDGTIIFGSSGGLYRVSSSGGTPVKITDQSAAVPVWLTAGRFLFLGLVPNGIFAGSLTGAKSSLLLPDASAAVFVPRAKSGLPDQLLFLRSGTLFAQSIDAEKAELRGGAVPVAEHIGNLGDPRIPAFSASATGVLVFGGGQSGDRELVWLDRAGKKLETVSRSFPLARNPAIRLSADDSRAIVPVAGASTDLWIAELNRNTLSRFTFDGSTSGIWSPDGRKVLWVATDGNRYLRPADGSGKDELLFASPSRSTGYVEDWSSDGKRITFSERSAMGGNNIWLMEPDGDRKPYPYHETRFTESWNAISPDGQWIAYKSDQPGRFEILVATIPAGKGRLQISTEGGDWPVWRRDGKELFFSQGAKLMAAPIRLTKTSVDSGKPQVLFELPASARFQVSRDGRRFLVAMPVEGAPAAAPLTVDSDWRVGVSK